MTISAAELDRLLKLGREPKFDARGKCLHVRIYYQPCGMSSMYVCPDCKWIAPLDWRPGRDQV